LPPDATAVPGLALVVVHFVPDADPTPALAALPAARRVLVRPPALAALPVPPGVELSIDPEYERAAIATRTRRAPGEVVVVLLDDERLAPELAAALTALATTPHTAACFDAERRTEFLGRAVPSGAVTIAWRGAPGARSTPTRLPAWIATEPATVTGAIDRLQGLAAHVHRTSPVGLGEFVRRPLAALCRRLWLRRRAGIPGVVLSIVETYGEVLRAAQAWERHGIAVRRAERQTGVPAGFHIWRTPWGTLTLRDGTPPALREALLDATPDVVAGMPLAGGRGAVWAVPLADGQRGVLRWYRRGGAVRHLIYDRYFGWTPRPIRELALTEIAIGRGVPAPQVLAARVDRLPFGWYRGAIVTREVSDAATFADVLRRLADGPERHRMLSAVGRAVRDLHDRGIHHRDLNANNILVDAVDGAWRVYFIDFDRAVVHRVVGSRVRERELRRLERSLAKLARGGMPLGGDDTRVIRAAYAADGEGRTA
jgi:tRNA A-37 threonylcarbamoyl transferase component Bud32